MLSSGVVLKSGVDAWNLATLGKVLIKFLHVFALCFKREICAKIQ